MRSFTPQISWHNRDPILSVDIQNRLLTSTDTSVSYRLATSGNDTHVIVWKTTINDPILATNGSKRPNVSLECLADLTKHQRSVNVVRFSPNLSDNLLAAGDDDYYIYVWKLTDETNDKPNPKQEFCVKHKDNSDDEIQVLCSTPTSSPSHEVAVKVVPNPEFAEEVIAKEVWKPYKILRGHAQDVSDICWSPDGQRLISGSVDNTAIVWDVHKGQKLHKIVEHKGFVQGVAWDPLNKYLATLSADRSLRILDSKNGRTLYRVHRMRTEDDKTSRLFYDDTLRSFCRRLTFTPGGEFLIAPSGILEQKDDIPNDNNEDSNKYINTSYVFERNSLNKPTFYLPSKKYTIAVSCCPKLFRLQENLENPFQFGYRIVFAVATQNSVLFYDSQQTLPFAQVSQIHYLRLTDISWSPDGRMLIVSSTDGFATFITFEANEFGIPYDGPKFNFEELETSSPVSNAKNMLKVNPILETTPEVDKLKPKVSTPSIKSFFTPTQEIPKPFREEITAKENQNNCQQNGHSFPTKHENKSPNVLIPRKKIKLTTLFSKQSIVENKQIESKPIETIEID